MQSGPTHFIRSSTEMFASRSSFQGSLPCQQPVSKWSLSHRECGKAYDLTGNAQHIHFQHPKVLQAPTPITTKTLQSNSLKINNNKISIEAVTGEPREAEETCEMDMPHNQTTVLTMGIRQDQTQTVIPKTRTTTTLQEPTTLMNSFATTVVNQGTSRRNVPRRMSNLRASTTTEKPFGKVEDEKRSRGGEQDGVITWTPLISLFAIELGLLILQMHHRRGQIIRPASLSRRPRITPHCWQLWRQSWLEWGRFESTAFARYWECRAYS